MQVNREQFLEQGYLILRNVVPPNELEGLRKSYEILVERQRAIWARDRALGDPPGGVWESSPQPRLILNPAGKNGSPLIDHETASAVEFWLHENTQGASSQLMDVNDAAVTEMFLMCNPVRDRGPANWHRDIHPIDTAPLMGYIEDIKENGPSYVQWNIPLYDDEVLWVVPGSHIRLNTEEENCQLLDNPCTRYSVAAYKLTWRRGMVSSTSPPSFTGEATTAPNYVVLSMAGSQVGEETITEI